MSKYEGFTLLELIIVIIVIGILSSVALPRYQIVVEKSRVAEAKHILGEIRFAQMRYYNQYYTWSNNMNNLDLEIPNTSKFFTYQAGNFPNWVGRAVRIETLLPPGFSNYRIFIADNGTYSIDPSGNPYDRLL